MPILEWRDLKILPTRDDLDPYPFQPDSTEYPSEPIGCWSTQPALVSGPSRSDNVVYHIGLDVSYHRIPFNTRYQPSNDPNEHHLVFSNLAALIYRSSAFSPSDIAPSWVPPPDPEREPWRFDDIGVSPQGHHRLPEAHLSCFDRFYYATSGADLYEWRFGFSPAWRVVGKWLRFSQMMHETTKEYLDALFGNEVTPVSIYCYFGFRESAEPLRYFM